MNAPTEAEIVQPEMALAVKDSQPIEPKPAIVTAQQARIEAVAELTKVALAKAGTLQLTPEESKALSSDFADDCFQPGAAGKENLIYIEHASLRDRFNSVLGLGQWAIIVRETWNEEFVSPKGTKGVRVYCRAMLLVRGCYVGESVGDMDYYPSNGSQNYGDAFEGAKTAAFRRCAKEFGIGLQAWRKDWCAEWWNRKRSPKRPPERSEAYRADFAPKTKPQAKPATNPANVEATQEQKAKFLTMLQPVKEAALRYANDQGWILPTEGLEDIPLSKVPNTQKRFQAIMDDIMAIMDFAGMPRASEAQLADPDNMPPEDDFTIKGGDEWFRDVIVPIPPKGMKRDDYLKDPRTINDLEKNELFGWWANFQPKSWTDKKGNEHPPSDADIKFREALDAAGTHYGFLKKD